MTLPAADEFKLNHIEISRRILAVDSMPRQPDPALPERRRGQILDAARECFRERGFRLTTIEEICAEARISPGMLYRYFDSKADIIATIALDARAEAEAMLERVNGSEGLIEGLAELARVFFETFDGDGDAALLADIWAEAARDPLLAKALQVRDQIAVGRLAAAVERAQRAGSIYPALPAAEAAEALIAGLEGMALRRSLRREREAAEAVRRYRILALHILKPKR
jgi:TetR/AcrR family transcriptional regulator, repressor for uid operon